MAATDVQADLAAIETIMAAIGVSDKCHFGAIFSDAATNLNQMNKEKKELDYLASNTEDEKDGFRLLLMVLLQAVIIGFGKGEKELTEFWKVYTSDTATSGNDQTERAIFNSNCLSVGFTNETVSRKRSILLEVCKSKMCFSLYSYWAF